MLLSLSGYICWMHVMHVKQSIMIKINTKIKITTIPLKIISGIHQCIESMRATHSQADQRYASFSCNHHCTCIALTFLVYHNEGLHFNTMCLHRVLQQGDALHVVMERQLLLDSKFQENHLTVEEMPKLFFSDSQAYNVSMNLSNLRVGLLKAVHAGCQMGLGLVLAEQLGCLTQDISLAFLHVTP